ncbi:unnamed protein product [Protopolystoma xenopodis]|uniref:Uncharacterized protein n=1 Tax=Protopolystoma xenopodis TaxID=117903 RepID=A0A3S5ARE1_9PLAT|nr:unnamed protein product [Protopolystoma xenopodis]
MVDIVLEQESAGSPDLWPVRNANNAQNSSPSTASFTPHSVATRRPVEQKRRSPGRHASPAGLQAMDRTMGQAIYRNHRQADIRR